MLKKLNSAHFLFFVESCTFKKQNSTRFATFHTKWESSRIKKWVELGLDSFNAKLLFSEHRERWDRSLNTLRVYVDIISNSFLIILLVNSISFINALEFIRKISKNYRKNCKLISHTRFDTREYHYEYHIAEYIYSKDCIHLMSV